MKKRGKTAANSDRPEIFISASLLPTALRVRMHLVRRNIKHLSAPAEADALRPTQLSVRQKPKVGPINRGSRNAQPRISGLPRRIMSAHRTSGEQQTYRVTGAVRDVESSPALGDVGIGRGDHAVLCLEWNAGISILPTMADTRLQF